MPVATPQERGEGEGSPPRPQFQAFKSGGDADLALHAELANLGSPAARNSSLPMFKLFEVRRNLMSIEQTNTVDFVTIDNTSGDALLTISDHLPWNENEGVHLELLQSKLNSYLRFVESGELVREFPEIRDRSIVINLVGMFPLSEQAKIFIGRARDAVQNAGIQLRCKIQPSN